MIGVRRDKKRSARPKGQWGVGGPWFRGTGRPGSGKMMTAATSYRIGQPGPAASGKEQWERGQ